MKPKASQMIAAPIHKDAVAGIPSSIRLSTLMWACEYDVTLPVKISFICVQYCSGRDLSKPHSSSTFLINCGVAFLPAIRAAGLVAGTTLKIRKTRMEIAKRTATAPRMRLMRKRSIGSDRSDRVGVGGARARLEADFRFRVERVAQAVAEDVHREHREQDRGARDDRQQRLAVERFEPFGDHRSPGGAGRLDAGTEVGEHRL